MSGYDATPAQIEANQRDMEENEPHEYGECRCCLSRLRVAYEPEAGGYRPVGLEPVDAEEMARHGFKVREALLNAWNDGHGIARTINRFLYGWDEDINPHPLSPIEQALFDALTTLCPETEP